MATRLCRDETRPVIASPRAAEGPAQPLVHTAHVSVLEQHVDAFRQRLLAHAEQSREETGCLRFDVYEEASRPRLFLLFEIYRDAASLDAHRASAHFAAFRRDVDAWVTERHWWFWNGPLAR